MDPSVARPLPRLGLIVSAMLSARADRVHARGAGTESGVDSVEEYWRWGHLSRLRKDGHAVASGPAGSTVTVPRRPVETSPASLPWLGWTDRLLRPEQLLVWGRPGEDWRLGEVEGWSDARPGAVLLSLERVDDGRWGAAHVDPGTGRVLLLALPGTLRWELTDVDDDPDVSSSPVERWFAGCREPGRDPGTDPVP